MSIRVAFTVMAEPQEFEVFTEPAAYTVLCLPAGNSNRLFYSVFVEYFGNGIRDDVWMVTRDSDVFDVDGNLSLAPSLPEVREEQWGARHEFARAEALSLAARIAPTLTCNGYTVADALASPLEMAHRQFPRQVRDEHQNDDLYRIDTYRTQVQALGVTGHRPSRHRARLGAGQVSLGCRQTFALLHSFRRLRIRWEIRDDIHEAFLRLGCAIICFRRRANLQLC